MSTKTPLGRKSSGKTREWRWRDVSEQSQIIPQSWADAGAHEEGETQFYAVEVRFGRRFEMTVDHTGQSVAGPHRDEAGIQTMYVTADGGRAVVVETAAHRDGDDVTPTEDWPSVIGRPQDYGTTVAPEQRDAYRSLVRDLYQEDN